jgi:beta-lactam-binding protein with PASTA domain
LGALIAVAVVAAVLLWLFGGSRKRAVPAPEDDVTTAIDREELEAAERELAEDTEAQDVDDEEEDWGPGTR